MMPDIVCNVCGVPKPEVCYDHGEAHAGFRKDTCQSCLRDLRSNGFRRYRRSAKGRVANRRTLAKHPERYLDISDFIAAKESHK